MQLEQKLKNVHPHRFRRTFATMALKKGMDVEEIQQVLGHQNINTTMIYVNVDKSSVKEKYKNAHVIFLTPAGKKF